MFIARRKIQFVVAFAVIAVLLLGAVAAFAQTPEPYTSTTLLDATKDMADTWNLWPFLIAFAVVGIVVYVLRRGIRSVR